MKSGLIPGLGRRGKRERVRQNHHQVMKGREYRQSEAMLIEKYHFLLIIIILFYIIIFSLTIFYK